MHLPTPEADQLHAEARNIAIRLIHAAHAMPVGASRARAAQLLADGPVGFELMNSAGPDPYARGALALLVTAELALHTRQGPPRPRESVDDPCPT